MGEMKERIQKIRELEELSQTILGDDTSFQLVFGEIDHVCDTCSRNITEFKYSRHMIVEVKKKDIEKTLCFSCFFAMIFNNKLPKVK